MIEDLSEEQKIRLSDLILSIKRINTKYSVDGPLSPRAMKGNLKIDILREIQNRNYEINKIKVSSKYVILYDIQTLSSEYISPILKKRISFDHIMLYFFEKVVFGAPVPIFPDSKD